MVLFIESLVEENVPHQAEFINAFLNTIGKEYRELQDLSIRKNNTSNTFEITQDQLKESRISILSGKDVLLSNRNFAKNRKRLF